MKSTAKILSVTVFSLTSFLLTPSLYAEKSAEKHDDKHEMEHDTEHKDKAKNGIEALSPELRKLLSKEMVALQSGMMAVIPAYVSGRWTEIEAIGQKMKESYILKQNLSDEQVHELHTALPEGFIKLDQEFHYLSGMLNHAAKSKKPELIGFYFSKLNESCVECHIQFATHKFPDLIIKNEKDEHSH